MLILLKYAQYKTRNFADCFFKKTHLNSFSLCITIYTSFIFYKSHRCQKMTSKNTFYFLKSGKTQAVAFCWMRRYNAKNPMVFHEIFCIRLPDIFSNLAWPFFKLFLYTSLWKFYSFFLNFFPIISNHFLFIFYSY